MNRSHHSLPHGTLPFTKAASVAARFADFVADHDGDNGREHQRGN